jgi:hypothetical protein
MKATVVHTPKLRRYVVESRYLDGEWGTERRFKTLDKAKKYADKSANWANNDFQYRVVDSLLVTTSWEEIINSARVEWFFVDQTGKEFPLP